MYGMDGMDEMDGMGWMGGCKLMDGWMAGKFFVPVISIRNAMLLSCRVIINAVL